LTTFSVGENVTTFTDSTAVQGSPFFYRVLATNLVGDAEVYPAPSVGFPHKSVDSAPSNTVTVSGLPGPNPPSELVATLRSGLRVALVWTDNSEDETAFMVERAVNGGAFSPLARVGRFSGTFRGSYTDRTVTPDNIYQYRVNAVNLAGVSAWSNTAAVEVRIPAAPSNLTAVATAGRLAARVTLGWTDNADNEAGFRIQRATDPAFTTDLVTRTVGADRIGFVAGSLPFGTSFYFRVQAYNLAGTSAWVEAVPFPVTTP
ncbi:MAG: fibronectin type III domain-containing protein, partial [Myxococcaceae bacterium]